VIVIELVETYSVNDPEDGGELTAFWSAP